MTGKVRCHTITNTLWYYLNRQEDGRLTDDRDIAVLKDHLDTEVVVTCPSIYETATTQSPCYLTVTPYQGDDSLRVRVVKD